ncbi:MAG: hypothetical protein ABIN36_13835 [Ferruginibacter sp.]
MRIFISICLITLFSINSYSQEKELEHFKIELNFYIDFLLGKAGAVAINPANQAKFRKNVDDAFKAFVVHKNSYNYDKLVQAKNDDKTKYLRLDQRITIYLESFFVNNKTYVVYSFTSSDKNNYLIKEIETNAIVYEGNSTAKYIADLYMIDKAHFLLIEKTGDFSSSREAMVLLTNKEPWTKINAFEGKAFGQVPAQYYIKKYVQKRDLFQLKCEMDYTLSAPNDVNKIFFDAATKTMSYKQYSRNNQYKLVKAKWENEKFIIDDYNVSENLSGADNPVPQ